jgi:hypothetical protein
LPTIMPTLMPTPLPTKFPSFVPSARGYHPEFYCPRGYYRTPETFYNGTQRCAPCSVGGWFCPPGSITPFGQLYMNETESICPAGFGCLPGAQVESASVVECAAGFFCPAGSIDQQGRVGSLETCSSTVALFGKPGVSAENRVLSGRVPQSIKGHCAVNLNRTLVVLNGSDGYLCARDRSDPAPILDGRIVLAGVSTCTVAEQAKTAEQAGVAALLISPHSISHDVPGACPAAIDAACPGPPPSTCAQIAAT